MKFLCTFLVLSFAGIVCDAEISKDTSELFRKLDKYLNSAVKTYHFNGSVLISHKGEVILQKGYGFKNYTAKTLNDTNTIFQIGSLTKPFTAIIILKLQEQGKLSVNDKLRKYFPEQKDADKITLQNLLNHTSGLYDFTRDIPENDSSLLSHPVSKQKVLDVFIHRSLEFKPGTKYSYCSSDYFLLGMIIEKTTGMPYELAVRKLIFEPLKMSSSGFDFINLRNASKASGYLSISANKYTPNIQWDSTVTYAAGAIYSTTGDLYKWSKAIANKQILSAESWKQAFTPGLGNHGDGWWIDSLFNRKYVYHSGGLPGFMSYFVYYPDNDVTIILLNNFGNYGDSLIQISSALSAIVFDKPYALWDAKTAIQLDPAILKKYIGTYTLDGKVKIFITLKNQLFAESSSSNGIPKLPIYPKSENEFFFKELNAVFEFTSADGKVSGLISHENRGDVVFKKIK